MLVMGGNDSFGQKNLYFFSRHLDIHELRELAFKQKRQKLHNPVWLILFLSSWWPIKCVYTK